MRRIIIVIGLFVAILSFTVSTSVSAQSVNSEYYYTAQPDDQVEIRMEMDFEGQTFTYEPINVTIFDPKGGVIYNDNITVTSITHLWFAWVVPHDAPLGNHTIFAYDYVNPNYNVTAIVEVSIPYIIVIKGFVMNSFGNSYPSYPITFVNFNRSEIVQATTDQEGFYSLALYNTTLGDTLYGIAKMIAEESTVTLTVEGNFTQSFRTAPLQVNNGIGGGGNGANRVNAVAQRDAIFFGSVTLAVVSLGTVTAMLAKMSRAK